MSIKQKVFVGLSGGVDSSVSAALLKEATPNNFQKLFGRPTPEGFRGYDVTGVFIKVWQADFLPCTWREERREAMRAAAHLGIPFLTLDLEKEYKKEVVDYMIREYGAGRVPNPDVMCNKHVKFGAFLDFAKKEGADFIATGHYAKIQFPVSSGRFPVNAKGEIGASGWQLEAGNWKLFAGADKNKDQSYFLWTLKQEQLAHTLFPVGHLQKAEVRDLARKFGLPNAEKKDSQGLCFMGTVDMPQFLKHYLKTEKGLVLNESGKAIGTHDGALLYTIGQRHGFFIEKKSATEQPYFIVGKNMKENTITAMHRDRESVSDKLSTVSLEACNPISAKLYTTNWIPVLIRTRYREPLVGGRWKMTADEGGKYAQITFDHPHEIISGGQSVVVYDDEECLGGGVVA